VPGTLRVITARMDYLPRGTPPDWIARERAAQDDPQRAVVSVYARGRDYHKVLRARLQALADRLAGAVGPLGHRVFSDSAPVMEVELASRSGLGWRGKHTLTLSREAGSMAFLGEIYIDLPLPLTAPVSDHCGSCSACIDICPTQAIVAPYRLDARRCISYLTIEHDGAIPLEFRRAMGNRIYGCDDCQLVCPWNRYAGRSALPDFDEREPLGHATLLQLWAWDAAEFARRSEGSAIRRIGHVRWQRNLAVALGNAWRASGVVALAQALVAGRESAGPLVQEHIDWALAQGQAVGDESPGGVESA
jgi:epoxyqueuosine reductase